VSAVTFIMCFPDISDLISDQITNGMIFSCVELVHYLPTIAQSVEAFTWYIFSFIHQT
jgi:hypothetical protein